MGWRSRRAARRVEFQFGPPPLPRSRPWSLSTELRPAIDHPPASPPRRCSSYAEGSARDTVVEALLQLSPHPTRSPARSCSTPVHSARTRFTLSPLLSTPAGASSPFTKIMGDLTPLGDTPSKWCHSLHGSPYATSGSRNAKAHAHSSPPMPMLPRFGSPRRDDRAVASEARWASGSSASSKKSRPRTHADSSPSRGASNPAKRLCFDDPASVTPVAKVEDPLASTEDPARLFRIFKPDRRRSLTDGAEAGSDYYLHEQLDIDAELDSLITPAYVSKVERASTFGPSTTLFSPQVAVSSPPSALKTAKSPFSPNSITRIGPNGGKMRAQRSAEDSARRALPSSNRSDVEERGPPEPARVKNSFDRTAEEMLGLSNPEEQNDSFHGAASLEYGVKHSLFLSPLAASRMPPTPVRITPASAPAVKKESAGRPTSGNGPRKGRGMMCNCKKSRCLKLYCDCFAHQAYCSSQCNCHDCYNTMEKEPKRRQAIKSILDRNPKAFKTKISREGKSHSVGCHCKKSQCLKKYCECFQGGIVCADKCKCEQCLNFPGSEEMIARRIRLKLPPAQLPVKAEPDAPQEQKAADVAMGTTSADAGDVMMNLVKRPPKILRVTQGNFAGRTGVISPFGIKRDAGCVEWLDFSHPDAEAERTDFLDGITPLTYTITAARGLPRGPVGLCTPTPPRRRRSAAELSDSLLSLRRSRKGSDAKYPIFGPGMAHVSKAMVFQVFMFLDNDDLYNACLVCRFWENLALDDHLWEKTESDADAENACKT
eukprot:scaffold1396_cov252-Pinguiococcus_pyrenoidosus.AAC.3